MTAGAGGRSAIVAGAGALPAALAAALPERPFVAALEGFAPAGLTPDLTFRLERLVPFLDRLVDEGVARVVFAGAVRRSAGFEPALFDPGTAALLPRLMAAMAQGDDATLREVVAVFEEAGLAVAGVEEVAPALIPGPGVLAGRIGPQDDADAARAAAIVAALGRVDVGQACVVARGLCLGVEALPGTDALLAQVAAIPAAARPRGGLLWKAAKPGQDRRIDLPTLGPDTVARAADAGLAGIAWAAGDVICLDLSGMTQAAQARGLFLWAR